MSGRDFGRLYDHALAIKADLADVFGGEALFVRHFPRILAGVLSVFMVGHGDRHVKGHGLAVIGQRVLVVRHALRLAGRVGHFRHLVSRVREYGQLRRDVHFIAVFAGHGRGTDLGRGGDFRHGRDVVVTDGFVSDDHSFFAVFAQIADGLTARAGALDLVHDARFHRIRLGDDFDDGVFRDFGHLVRLSDGQHDDLAAVIAYEVARSGNF